MVSSCCKALSFLHYFNTPNLCLICPVRAAWSIAAVQTCRSRCVEPITTGLQNVRDTFAKLLKPVPEIVETGVFFNYPVPAVHQCPCFFVISVPSAHCGLVRTPADIIWVPTAQYLFLHIAWVDILQTRKLIFRHLNTNEFTPTDTKANIVTAGHCLASLNTLTFKWRKTSTFEWPNSLTLNLGNSWIWHTYLWFSFRPPFRIRAFRRIDQTNDDSNVRRHRRLVNVFHDSFFVSCSDYVI